MNLCKGSLVAMIHGMIESRHFVNLDTVQVVLCRHAWYNRDKLTEQNRARCTKNYYLCKILH